MPEQPQFELLADQHPVEAGQLRPAEPLRQVQVHQADLVRLGDDVGRMGLMLVTFGRARPDLVLRERAREGAQLLLLVGEGERDAAGDTPYRLWSFGTPLERRLTSQSISVAGRILPRSSRRAPAPRTSRSGAGTPRAAAARRSSTGSAGRSATASAGPSSARTARARRPCSRSPARSSSRAAARSRSSARRWGAPTSRGCASRSGSSTRGSAGSSPRSSPSAQVIRTGATATIGYFAERLSELDLDRADGLLGTFGLGPLGERRFGDCSQGERKRALIARALVARPRLLLLDEPGAGLDLPGRETLLASLDRLAARPARARDRDHDPPPRGAARLDDPCAAAARRPRDRHGPGRGDARQRAAERVPRDPRRRLPPRRALGGDGLSGLARRIAGGRGSPSCRASRAAPATTHANARARTTPRTPPGSASWKITMPAAIGSAFVSRLATPAVASALPRWNPSWSATNARP